MQKYLTGFLDFCRSFANIRVTPVFEGRRRGFNLPAKGETNELHATRRRRFHLLAALDPLAVGGVDDGAWLGIPVARLGAAPPPEFTEEPAGLGGGQRTGGGQLAGGSVVEKGHTPLSNLHTQPETV